MSKTFIYIIAIISIYLLVIAPKTKKTDNKTELEETETPVNELKKGNDKVVKQPIMYVK